jgi:hypothetical protein
MLRVPGKVGHTINIIRRIIKDMVVDNVWNVTGFIYLLGYGRVSHFDNQIDF